MRSEKNKYQKAVKLKKEPVVVMATIDPAANKHCPILRSSPVEVPGVPAKSFIFSSQTQKLKKKWIKMKKITKFLSGQESCSSPVIIQTQNG